MKVYIRPCRPEDPMSFTVLSKKAKAREAKWNTAGKVTIIFPQTWGRLNKAQMESYIEQSFQKF